MTGSPRSKEFDDVYFSAADGLAETQHVFFEGNRLPGRWAGRDSFTICETGFGTGLNFLATWKLFSDTKQPGQKLHFISFEKFPLSREEIKEYLEPWRGELGVQLDALCDGYEKKDPVLRLRFSSSCAKASEDGQDDISLELIFGDVNEELPKLNEKIDCWFLDGFRPRVNPEMWSEVVFQNMVRLSSPGTTYATFTAAAVVKNGLKAVGFTVKRTKGFGWKWHMISGELI